MLIRQFIAADTDSVIALWEACGLTRPWNDPRRDIERKLAEQPELFLVGVAESGAVIASAMAGYDGHRGWAYYVAVSPELQRTHLGKQLMTEVERMLRDRGCVKLNLQIRSDNEKVLGFYRGLGYGEEQVVSMGKRLTLD